MASSLAPVSHEFSIALGTPKKEGEGEKEEGEGEAGKDGLSGKDADRAKKVAEKHGDPMNQGHVMMDLSATIAQGVPLRLKELLAADDFNFIHDVWGIQRHLNRETGKLENHFWPRFAAI